MYYSAIFKPVDEAAALAAFPYSAAVNSDFTPIGGGLNFAMPQGRNVGQGQVVDDLSITSGNHSFKVGVNYRYDKVTDYVYSARNVFPLVGEFDIGTLASGVWDYYQQRFPTRTSQPFTLYSLGVYGQDAWKVSNRLTLTLALRADHNSNPKCLTNCFSLLNTPFDQLTHDVNIPYDQAIKSG